ncbi:hypothetical protein ARAF_2286 [Arsenophonus endosymbiont of Aleurodicus floccissimus]|uniref:DUF721 domain-containing protein n=1 Tax=Arsenophonus endosymbiont of Aleurodicus floccissimus TaxID=2152761 RepID=UPI000E6B42CD|nr:DciA family protein [Arsenophonus endosymbiont of Aleurodicus floccissimus]SPP32247.1 hypothetical protein ARAF_2286 [Arsenophonus endosymbiont of Aleurodicus floccissimus]
MRDSYPQSLNILLKESNLESNTLQTIQQRAQALIKLNNTVISLLPIELKAWCRVANYRQHILILEVTNASRKVRLNYELPTLLSTLRHTILPSLSSINIMINPSLSSKNCLSFQQIAIKPSKQIISQLSKESAKTIRNLAKRSPKKLKGKLERLAALAGENTKATSNKD